MSEENTSKKDFASRSKVRRIRLKSILDIIMIILVAASVGISVKSCQISEGARDIAQHASKVSENSNTIAKEALNTSKQQFIQINRPYILVSPKKFEDDQYWQLFLEHKTVVKRIKYEVRNVGNVAATNLSLPDIMRIDIKSAKPIDGIETSFEKPGRVTLGPGDSFNLNTTFSVAYTTTQDAKKNMDFYLSEEYEGDTFRLSITYENELEVTKKYRTVIVNRIHNDKARIIKSEMLILDKGN